MSQIVSRDARGTSRQGGGLWGRMAPRKGRSSEATLLPVLHFLTSNIVCSVRLCRAEYITLFNVRFFFCPTDKIEKSNSNSLNSGERTNGHLGARCFHRLGLTAFRAAGGSFPLFWKRITIISTATP